MELPEFRYQPRCSWPGCEQAALYKIAAPWSFGAGRELKNYGLCCEEHRESAVARAAAKAGGLAPAEGEQLGPIGVYVLKAGVRDAELSPSDGLNPHQLFPSGWNPP